jgi:hypothetical protein
MTRAKEHTLDYEVITQKDDNGDVLVPVPFVLLKELGWNEGDEIKIDIDKQGRFILSKVTE